MTERKTCGALKVDGTPCRGLATSTGYCRPHSPRKTDDEVKKNLISWIRNVLIPGARSLQRSTKCNATKHPMVADFPGYSDKDWQGEFPTGDRVVEDLLMLAEDYEYCCKSWLESLEGK